MGIAKECARFVLPCNTTKIYMSGLVRSRIHYIDLNLLMATEEHIDIANECKCTAGQFPVIAEALGWTEIINKTYTRSSDESNTKG